jgi:hypothetical protein
MTHRPARVTQADIARALRAAKQTGARMVKIEPDGTMWIDPNGPPGENPQLAKERLAAEREAVL